MQELIPIFVILPLLGAFLIPVLGRVIPHFSKMLSALILLLLCYLITSFLFNSNKTEIIYEIGGWEPVNNITIGISMVLDGLSSLLLLIINLIGFLACIYSFAYMKKFTSENNFYALLCLMIAGMNGVVLSGDIFNIYVFLEIAVIASYALVAFGIEKSQLEASFKYQVLGGIASLLILFGVALLYWQTKTLNIAEICNILSTSDNNTFVKFTQIILIAGFGLKAAIIPFHAWLPDAHSSAPSPISAMLSGVLIKAIGIYALIRLFFNMFELSNDIAILITILGSISMIIGGFLAFGQKDIKRMFAYSSISQVGYIIIGFGIAMQIITQNGDEKIAALAITGSLFHLLNHAVFKGLLFLNAGAIEHATGKRNLDELGGLHSRMPITSSTSFSASMSVAGIPPFSGFFSKLIIIIAAIQAQFYLIAVLAVLVSIITIAMYLRFQRYAFYNKLSVNSKLSIKSTPLPMAFSMVVLALLCFALSILVFPGARDLILTPAVDSLVEATSYLTQTTGI